MKQNLVTLFGMFIVVVSPMAAQVVADNLPNTFGYVVGCIFLGFFGMAFGCLVILAASHIK